MGNTHDSLELWQPADQTQQSLNVRVPRGLKLQRGSLAIEFSSKKVVESHMIY